LLQLRILSAVLVLLSIAPVPRAAQPAAAEPGITGQVLAPDGSPVTRGTVGLLTAPIFGRVSVTATIDRTGHFRVVPDAQGRQPLVISVPGYAPYRANLTVPPSRIMALPEITLLEATYFHARFATIDGEPLAASGVRRRSIDVDGQPIPDPLEHVREEIERDGSITIGPLPPGRTLFAFDRPPFAQMRLPNANVTGVKRVIEGGTITIPPGSQLHVDIIDAAERPVPNHDVWIEDAVQPSPLSMVTVKTNNQGRAIFDRLALGRYRVWTRLMTKCGGAEPTMSRLVATGNSGIAHLRMVIDGRAAFRITTMLGPVLGRGVTVTPDPPPPPTSQLVGPSGRRLPMLATASRACSGVTDSDGRVVLTPFPAGPAQLRVSLFNSSYFASVNVPESGREMVIAVPVGLIPVKVISRTSQHPVEAQLTWVGGGGRVETLTNANGDALMEGVGTSGGTLTVHAREHQTVEGVFDETPETMQEVALMPSPASRLTVRVVRDDAKVPGDAVVELLARGPADVAEFAVTDAKGVATFTDVPPGPLQFRAHAEGFAPAIVRIEEDTRASILITLKPTR
jgi:hypothetical protein